MRRKQAESLVAAEQEVQRLEAGYAEAMTGLSAEWSRYQETRAQNDQLRAELEMLRAVAPGEVRSAPTSSSCCSNRRHNLVVWGTPLATQLRTDCLFAGK
jgi:hypothetical protein